jgi:non-specific serine/threonine protein kinase
VQLTSFVGRRQELLEVKRLLGAARLLTLTGSGGAGKTRLALRTAEEMGRAFPGGVCFIDLAPLGDPWLVNQAVFAALGLKDVSSRWSVSTLADYLSDKRMLLVFDNCEHLLDACAVLIDTLLRSCPHIRVLATSREALGTPGEVRMRVPSMSVPAGGPLSAPAVIASDAVALFEARAMAAAPDFRVDWSNVAAVTQVCRRLDGIPLAIELAAVRLDTVSVEHLVDGLDSALHVLGEGSRGVVPRQRTLEAAINWSYQLLSDAERLLWARVSVFAGGFDVGAAAHVTGDESLPAERIPDLIARLVAKSIVMRHEVAGEERYRLLETLREYGRRRLQELGEERLLRCRHRDWVGELAASAKVRDASQARAFDRIERDVDNVFSALDLCLIAPDEAAAGLRICSDLTSYWVTRGPITHARTMLSLLLDLCPEADLVRANGLLTAGTLAVAQNDAPAARPLLEESLKLGRAAADSQVVGWSLDYLSVVLGLEGKAAESMDLSRTVLALARAMDDPFLAAGALSWLILVEPPELGGSEDSHLEALADAERSVSELEKRGELWNRSWLVMDLAVFRFLRGELDPAEALGRQAAALKQDLGDVLGLAYALEILSWVAASKGDPRRAASLLGGASRLWESAQAAMLDIYRADHERAVTAAQTTLGEAAYAAAYQSGAAMARDEIVAYALGSKAAAPAPRQTAREQPTSLTEREMQISRLIGEGMQTKHIAAKLFISERTVETHVTKILNKLGLASRLQLARWVITLDEAAV